MKPVILSTPEVSETQSPPMETTRACEVTLHRGTARIECAAGRFLVFEHCSWAPRYCEMDEVRSGSMRLFLR